jgi:hypothetical protein
MSVIIGDFGPAIAPQDKGRQMTAMTETILMVVVIGFSMLAYNPGAAPVATNGLQEDICSSISTSNDSPFVYSIHEHTSDSAILCGVSY